MAFSCIIQKKNQLVTPNKEIDNFAVQLQYNIDCTTCFLENFFQNVNFKLIQVKFKKSNEVKSREFNDTYALWS